VPEEEAPKEPEPAPEAPEPEPESEPEAPEPEPAPEPKEEEPKEEEHEKEGKRRPVFEWMRESEVRLAKMQSIFEAMNEWTSGSDHLLDKRMMYAEVKKHYEQTFGIRVSLCLTEYTKERTRAHNMESLQVSKEVYTRLFRLQIS
jgi:hypothetical protein